MPHWRYHFFIATAFVCGQLSLPAANGAATAHSALITTPRDISSALISCWQPPAGSEGLSATARFSFKRDGNLMGPPQITFSRLGNDDARSRAFLQSIADAFLACTPLSFSASFGQSVAGRIFTLRFIPALQRA